MQLWFILLCNVFVENSIFYYLFCLYILPGGGAQTDVWHTTRLLVLGTCFDVPMTRRCGVSPYWYWSSLNIYLLMQIHIFYFIELTQTVVAVKNCRIENLIALFHFIFSLYCYSHSISLKTRNSLPQSLDIHTHNPLKYITSFVPFPFDREWPNKPSRINVIN